MAEASVQSAVQWLGVLLGEEAENLQGVQRKLEQLRDELDWMQCFLREADTLRYNDHRIRRWILQVQEIAYEAEDIVETFLLKIISQRDQQLSGKASAIRNKLERYLCVITDAKAIHYAGSDIEALRAKISTLTSRLQAYGIKITRSENFRVDMEAIVNIETKVVGLDDHMKQIVGKLLVSKSDETRIFVVWGNRGIGKSTLARKVFYNQAIRKHFDRFAWVYVPRNYTIIGILRGLLSSLSTKSDEEIGLMMEQELINNLYEVQIEKKCLVILDNLWSNDIWNELMAAFPGIDDKDSGSKLLFTTNSKEVPVQLDEKKSIHEVKGLSQDESWQLLQPHLSRLPSHSFGNDGDTKLMEMAKKMLTSCQGIPLVIIALGGLLATLKTEQEWATLHEHMISHQQGKNFLEPSEHVLELCYYNLPYYLKNCFLHLANFPEDFRISAKKLPNIWVAEGIVTLPNGEASRGELLQDFAKHCLNQLVHRGMVVVDKRGSNGRIKSCFLHELVRDFCLSISEEENFLSIIDTDSYSLNTQIRRLSQNLRGGDEQLSLPSKSPLLRSLLLFPSQVERSELGYASVKALCRDSQLLRVLDFEGIGINSRVLPKETGDLHYLRYLSLKDMVLTRLPSSIASLRWLETLDLRLKSRVELPNVLWNLQRLRNLYLPRNFTLCDSEKLRLDNLSRLLTLKNADHFVVKDVLKMDNLRNASVNYMPEGQHIEFIKRSPKVVFRLTIFRASIGQDQVNVLQNFYNLAKLQLKGEISVPMVNLKFPPYLKKLLLDFCGIKEDPMPVLEKLPMLTSLCLDHQAYTGKVMVCTANGFPHLTYLRLNGLKNWGEWKVEQGAMPKLLHLEIKNCDMLLDIPDHLQQDVEISRI